MKQMLDLIQKWRNIELHLKIQVIYHNQEIVLIKQLDFKSL